jgi:diadenosine tetraphosphatase ApaH/serine/threonine PP2A family protein phosphatase
MRIGLISDIHGNLQALQQVLTTLGHLKVDRYVSLGDLVGYGGNPNEVVTLMRPMVDFSIVGNHDAAVSGLMDYSYYYEAAREVLDWTASQLSEDNLNWLKNQPMIILEDEICYVHGEPVQPELFNYLYSPEHARGLVPFYGMLKPITFVGHSHLRRVYEISPNEVIELPDGNFTLRPDRKYAVAIGSVGQPRDFDSRASFVVYDRSLRRVEFYRVAYDIDGAANRILNVGLPEYFATRLYSGS